MSRKPRLSKRRLEVLASYGALPKQAKAKPVKSANNDLPVHSPIRIQRELGLEGYDHQAAKQVAKQSKQARLNNQALRDKPRLNLTDEERVARKKASQDRSRSERNSIHMLGLLTAATAKALAADKSSIAMETSAPYFNYQDNFIENQYHGKTSAFDPRHNDLIEIEESGKMIWHGDTCAICTMPPSTIGEVMLAQYGEANFVCTDCGKLVETKGIGLRGWIFTNIKNFKRHKVRQIPNYMIPHDTEDEELD